jgi:hypothetical protein
MLEEVYGIKLQRPILRWIDQISDESERCTITASRILVSSEEDVQFFEAAIEGRRSFGIKKAGDIVECECNYVSAC